MSRNYYTIISTVNPSPNTANFSILHKTLFFKYFIQYEKVG